MSGADQGGQEMTDLHQILKTPSGIDPVIVEMHTQNDRGAAITGIVFLEQMLRNTIVKQWPPMSNTMFERLFKGYGPLASFSALIDVATAMGILHADTRNDFQRIKKIRNDAAHVGTPFSFTSKSIKSHLQHLPVQDDEMFDKHGESPERNQFTATIKILAAYLHFAAKWRKDHGHFAVLPHFVFPKNGTESTIAK